MERYVDTIFTVVNAAKADIAAGFQVKFRFQRIGIGQQTVFRRNIEIGAVILDFEMIGGLYQEPDIFDRTAVAVPLSPTIPGIEKTGEQRLAAVVDDGCRCGIVFAQDQFELAGSQFPAVQVQTGY